MSMHPTRGILIIYPFTRSDLITIHGAPIAQGTNTADDCSQQESRQNYEAFAETQRLSIKINHVHRIMHYLESDSSLSL